MTSVWFAASGSGEDGDEYDVHEVFATQAAAQAHCDRPDKPTWEHSYVQEWEVTGPILTDAERKAIQIVIGGFGMWVAQNELTDSEPLRLAVLTLRGLLERLA